MEGGDCLLGSELRVKRKTCEVLLASDRISWRPTTTTTTTTTSSSSSGPKARRGGCPPWKVALLSEVLAVWPVEQAPAQWQRSRPRPDLHAFTVYFVRRESRQKWAVSDVTFSTEHADVAARWVQAVRKQLTGQEVERPERLLVFVNPFGGRREGEKIYRQRVQPLLELASIYAHVIVTERANHARDFLLAEDLSSYNGVVCVGGDGMFSEIMHGVIGRTQSDAGLDEHNSATPLQPCPLRIGIIPAGSTDCVCFATVGTNDPVTSALHIIIGDDQPLDVCSVRQGERLLRYSVSLLGYGFYGDVLRDSETRRWMGPMRYDFSGFKTVMKNCRYEGKIEFRLAGSSWSGPRDLKRCRSGCEICSQTSEKLKGAEDEEERGGLPSPVTPLPTDDTDGWRCLEGEFVAVNVACMSCACPKSPQGLSPAAHLADGAADLIVVRKCSRLEFTRFLLRHTNKRDQFDFPFVEVYRVTELKFKPRLHEDDDDVGGGDDDDDSGGRGSRGSGGSGGSGGGSGDCGPSGASGPGGGGGDDGGEGFFHDLNENACGASSDALAAADDDEQQQQQQQSLCACRSLRNTRSTWNCDGEILHETDISVRVHGQLIKLFARGIEDQLGFG
ncbi:ceramide kinase [Lethenteron reissneri]|uniref:ceramide kinase n=1 Tax=Lethenteron reissneri TaxID=7753 RepID=UPI002AB74EDC|nr:ceramide kinase [Lethenteron reissneri]